MIFNLRNLSYLIGFCGCLTEISLMSATLRHFSLSAYSKMPFITDMLLFTVFGAKPFDLTPPEVRSSLLYSITSPRAMAHIDSSPKWGLRYDFSMFVYLATLDALICGFKLRSHSEEILSKVSASVSADVKELRISLILLSTSS